MTGDTTQPDGSNATTTRMDTPPMATIQTPHKTRPEDEASLRPLGMAIAFGVILAVAVAFLGPSPSAREHYGDNTAQGELQHPAQAGKTTPPARTFRTG
ncbi:hypothetical protein [Pannonibacter phragmitetus]|uniref:hypothetical protein n=1 Tax=Pannonibacter phragmitetus TaxID=121719 RepID=UPI003D2EE54C